MIEDKFLTIIFIWIAVAIIGVAASAQVIPVVVFAFITSIVIAKIDVKKKKKR
jgi:hypothetical protein